MTPRQKANKKRIEARKEQERKDLLAQMSEASDLTPRSRGSMVGAAAGERSDIASESRRSGTNRERQLEEAERKPIFEPEETPSAGPMFVGAEADETIPEEVRPAALAKPSKPSKPDKPDEDRPEELGILENRIEATDAKLAEIQAMLPEGKGAQSFYEKLADDAKKAYRSQRNTLMWLQAADQLAQGLVQWAAANAGAGTIKSSKADLSQNFKAIQEDYRDEVSSIGKRSAKVQDTVKEAIALRERYAIARDRYKREKAAADTRAEERAADKDFRAEQARLQREASKLRQDKKLAAQAARQGQKKKDKVVEQVQVPAAIKLLTDDPGVQRQLYAAALVGDKEFENTMGSAAVQKRLKPETLASLREQPGAIRAFFGAEPKIDFENLRESIVKSETPEELVAVASKTEEKAPLTKEDILNRYTKKGENEKGEALYQVDGKWYTKDGELKE